MFSNGLGAFSQSKTTKDLWKKVVIWWNGVQDEANKYPARWYKNDNVAYFYKIIDSFVRDRIEYGVSLINDQLTYKGASKDEKVNKLNIERIKLRDNFSLWARSMKAQYPFKRLGG